MEDLERRRYALIMSDVVAIVRHNLSLGLAIDQIQSVQDFIERQIELEPALTTITVFNDDGESLYETHQLPDHMRRNLLGDQGASDLNEAFTVLDIENDFGKRVGWVMARYSRDERLERRASIVRIIAVGVVGATLSGFLVIAVVASNLLRGVKNRLLRTATELYEVERETPGRDVEPASDRYEDRAKAVIAELDAIEQQIDIASDTPLTAEAGMARHPV